MKQKLMVGTRMEARMDDLERGSLHVNGRLGGIEESIRQLNATVLELVDSVNIIRTEDRGSRDGRGNREGTLNNEGHRDGDEGERANRGRDEERARRVEVPYFNGEDPYGWLYRAKRYFRINRIPVDEYVETAAICLEGRALNWFQWWENRNPTNIWNNFRLAVLERFHVSSSGNPYEALMSLRQEGTIAEYREQFELLLAPLRHADEEMIRAAFLNGLREDIRAEMCLHDLNELGRMMTLTQRIEEKEKVKERMGCRRREPAMRLGMEVGYT